MDERKYHNEKLKPAIKIDQDTFQFRNDVSDFFTSFMSLYPHVQVKFLKTEFIEDIEYITCRVFSPSVMDLAIDHIELNVWRNYLDNMTK